MPIFQVNDAEGKAVTITVADTADLALAKTKRFEPMGETAFEVTAPSATAKKVPEAGCWADVVAGELVSWPLFDDGAWYPDALPVEFTCEHKLAAFNAALGTTFSIEQFERDCCCEAVRAAVGS